uniref:Mediator of RNA polymerase II transcription subunit 4 n=2 Tax=Monodelphis domestica TaxID=13616 RepID=A0A5F8G916_MONDO
MCPCLCYLSSGFFCFSRVSFCIWMQARCKVVSGSSLLHYHGYVVVFRQGEGANWWGQWRAPCRAQHAGEASLCAGGPGSAVEGTYRESGNFQKSKVATSWRGKPGRFLKNFHNNNNNFNLCSTFFPLMAKHFKMKNLRLRKFSTVAQQIIELLIHRDGEFQELMKLALEQGKVHHEMQLLEKEVEKRDSDIQQLQKQLKEAEQILATAVYQAKEKLKSIDKARKGAISSEEIIKYAHRISASNAVCAPLTWVPGDPRRPYPTDLEMRSGLLGQMNNPSTNGVNGHLPGDALAAGRLPDVLAPQYPWQSSDMSVNMLPPNHSNDFMLEPPGHNKENEDDVEVMSTDSSSSSSDSD